MADASCWTNEEGCARQEEQLTTTRACDTAKGKGCKACLSVKADCVFGPENSHCMRRGATYGMGRRPFVIENVKGCEVATHTCPEFFLKNKMCVSGKGSYKALGKFNTPALCAEAVQKKCKIN